MTKKFYSNGKLLLSGEYAILDGAFGWAIPTKFGQAMTVSERSTSKLHWTSRDEKGDQWFEAVYALDSLTEISTSDPHISQRLGRVLQEARLLNPLFSQRSDGLEIETLLSFPKGWGLGTSSTLINNIAEWAQVDPYRLLMKTFGGSGYDIACARHNRPLLYQWDGKRAIIRNVTFDTDLKNSLYFIYLNKKQNSRDGIARYRSQLLDRHQLVDEISDLTQQLIACSVLSDFEKLLLLHEEKLSQVLGLPTVKESLFPDYPNAVKSLGAWGGDFIMATGGIETVQYFKAKGYETIIPYESMALD